MVIQLFNHFMSLLLISWVFHHFCSQVDRTMSETLMAKTAVLVGIAEHKPGFYRAFKFYHPADRNDYKHYRD